MIDIQNFLIDAVYLLAAFLWWKSATAAPESQEAKSENLARAYRNLDTAIELVYTCFDPRLLKSDSPFNPHDAGAALFNASAAFCTAVAVFLQSIRDALAPRCDDQSIVALVMLAFLLIVFLFPLYKYFFRRWKQDIVEEVEERWERKGKQ